MEVDEGDPSTVNKNPKIIKGAQEEVAKLDVLVCGICRDVFHFIEEFVEHKEKTCTPSNFNTNISETKPQLWAFLLWKSAMLNKRKSQEGGSNINSWKMYQRWCKMEEGIKDTWIAAGKALQCYSMIAHAKLQEVRVQNDGKTKIGSIRQEENVDSNYKDEKKVNADGEKVSSHSEDWNNISGENEECKSDQKDGADPNEFADDKKMDDDTIEIKEEKLSEEEGSRGAWDTEDMEEASLQHAVSIRQVKKRSEPAPDSNKVTRRTINRLHDGSSEDEYVVEKILAKRFNPKKKYYEYLLKWEGYPHEQNTWEPVHNMAACDKLVETFERNLAKQKLAQQQVAPAQPVKAPVNNVSNRKLVPNPTAMKAHKQIEAGPSGTESGRPVRSSKKKAMEQVKSWCGSMAKTTEFGKRKVGESSDSDDDEGQISDKRVKLEPPDDEDWSSGDLMGSQGSSGDENVVAVQGNQTKVVGVIHKAKEQLFAPVVKRSPGRPRKIRPEETGAINGVKARKAEEANELAIKLGLESDSSPESKSRSPQPGKAGQPPVLVANSKGVIKVDPRQVPNLTSGVYIVANKSNVVKLETLPTSPTSPTKGKILGVKQSMGKLGEPGGKAAVTSGVVRKVPGASSGLRPIAPAPVKVLQKQGTPGRVPGSLAPGIVKVSSQLMPRGATPGRGAPSTPRVLGPRPGSILQPRGTLVRPSPRPQAPTSAIVKRPIGIPGVQTKITSAVRPRVPAVGGTKVMTTLTAQTKSGVKPIQAMLGKAVQGQSVTQPLLLAKKKEDVPKLGERLVISSGKPVSGLRLDPDAMRKGLGRGRGRGITIIADGSKLRESKLGESDSVHMEFHQEETSSESESSDSLPDLPMGELPSLEPESPPRPFTLCPETGKILSRAEGEPTPPPSPPTPPPAPKDEPRTPAAQLSDEAEEILPDKPGTSPLYRERGETLLKVEMSPGGTTGTVIESSVADSQYVDTLRTTQGLTVTKIQGELGAKTAEPPAATAATTQAATATTNKGGGGISVPARKLFMEGGKLNEVVTVQGEDGVVYQIATEGQEGLEGAEGMQQCVYVTADQGDGTEEGAVLTLDTAVAEAVAQLMPDQVGVMAGGCPQFYIKEEDGSVGDGTEQLVMASVVDQQAADEGSQGQVVAHVVQEGEIIPGTGKRRVVLLLPDGNLMMTEVDEEQYAALNLDK